MNIVLFLGAGFSKPFGLPLMSEFYHFAKQHPDLSDDEKQLVDELKGRVCASASMLYDDEDNLEHLLSVGMIYESGVPSTSDALRAILRKVYGPRLRGADERIFDRLKTFASIGDLQGHQLTVVTTNYDVLAEFGFFLKGAPLAIPGDWKSMTKSSSDVGMYGVGTSTIRTICKLHGSINWWINKVEAGKLTVDDTVSTLHPHGHGNPFRAPGFLYQPSLPEPSLIVPPTFFKTEDPQALSPTWKEAFRAISVAQRITFVGYSFPRSDTYLRYFLGTALSKNRDIQSIDIVDPDASKLIKELNDSGAFGKTFLSKLQPHDENWEKSKHRLLTTTVQGG